MDNCVHRNVEIHEYEQIRIKINCMAGELSYTGFLAKGETIKEVIERDKQILKKYGITKEQILQKFNAIILIYRAQEYLYHKEHSEYPEDVMIYGMKVTKQGYRGAQECPFQVHGGYHGYEYGAIDYIIDKNKNRKIYNGCKDYPYYNNQAPDRFVFNNLHVHMFDMHDFLEGSVQHRVDLEYMIKFFDMKYGVDYSAKLAGVEECIESGGSTSGLNENEHNHYVDEVEIYIHDFKYVKTSQNGWLFDLNSNPDKKKQLDQECDYISIKTDPGKFESIIFEYHGFKFKIWDRHHNTMYYIIKHQIYVE